ncbi:TPA: thioesterase II family protein [Salmonella enterica subsp. enterica serovar Paratyphi B]
MNKFIIKPEPDERINFICFPYAGGYSSTYMQWQKLLSEKVRVCPVALSGRDIGHDTLRELNYDVMVTRMIKDILPQLEGCVYAIFGHSLGAWLSWSLALEGECNGNPPLCLIVSGQQSPYSIYPYADVSKVDNKELYTFLKDSGGMDNIDYLDPEIKESFINMIRKDIMLCESHVPCSYDVKINIPVYVFGAKDDKLIASEYVDEWRIGTTSDATFYWFDGGHFYLNKNKEKILYIINNILLKYISRRN